MSTRLAEAPAAAGERRAPEHGAPARPSHDANGRGTSAWFRDRTRVWVTGLDLVLWTYAYPVRWVSRLVPTNSFVRLSKLAIPTYLVLRRRRVREVQRHMERALGRPATGLEHLARDFVARELRKLVDDLLLPRLDLAHLHGAAHLEGVEHLDAALSDGNGVMLVSPHFHANRVAKSYLRRIGRPVLSIRKQDPASLALGRFGRRFSAPAFSRIIGAAVLDEVGSTDPALGAKVLQRLRSNGVVDTHVDAEQSTGRTRAMRFLEDIRPLAIGFLRIAERARTPIVFMWCRGDSDAFTITFEPPIRYPNQSDEVEFDRRFRELVERLEAGIRAAPVEWEFWASRFAVPKEA